MMWLVKSRSSYALAAAYFVCAFSGACASGCAGEDGDDPAAGIDESFLDRTVDPCTDFYQFACGTWIAEHPTDKASAVQRFTEGEGRTSYLLNKILEGDRKGMPYVTHATSMTLGNFYGSCMTSRSGMSFDRAPLDARLEEIAAASSSADLAKVVVTLHAEGIPVLFYLRVDSDPGSPARNIATFYASGMSLPDRRYYLDATMSVVPQYEEHVRRLTSLFPMTPPIEPAAVLNVETALARGVDADDNTGDPIAAYNVLTLDALTALSRSFPWRQYAALAGFPTLAEINVTRPVYLMKLDALWSSTPLDEMKTYLRWRVLENYAEAMGRDFVAEESRFHQGVFEGDPMPPPDWWACQQRTKWALGFALSQPYVGVVFNDEKMKASRDLIATIKSTFRQRLSSLSWIDAATKQEALVKLDKVAEKVGFPEVWPDEAPVASADSYLRNLLGVRRWYRQKNVEQIAQPVDRSVWSVPPCTTSAFYSRYENEIIFPAAILQTPLFSIGRARALNYGVMGVVVGHELTHGFDDDGRKFDGDGKLRSWWTDTTDQEFFRRSKCIVDQYASYDAVPGVKVDGVRTLGENIADLGGVKLAYAAYHASGANESLAGTFGPDAQFFIAYAQIWCANFREELARSLVRTDSHAPSRHRVNGVVSNVPEFAAAFGCPAGSPMAPKDRCEVW